MQWKKRLHESSLHKSNKFLKTPLIANSFLSSSQDKETEIVIPQDVDVTDSGDMYGLVVVMAHDKTQQSLPGINSTSTFAARIVFAHCKSSVLSNATHAIRHLLQTTLGVSECRKFSE